jgi:hypothetical protein
VTNPGHIIGFLSQWKVYLDQIPVGPEAQRFRGNKLDPTIFEKVRPDNSTPHISLHAPQTTHIEWPYFQLSEEQLSQMYELMRATKDIWKPVEPNLDQDPRR